MKVFISWSGEFSREVAEKLSIWIPCVIQSVEVFYSPNDIGKGENWNTVLSKALEEYNFGIVCLTPENVAAPWIHFEAGALSKYAGSGLSAIMLKVNTSDIKGPLSRFQNTRFEKTDFYKLMKAINAATEKPLKETVLWNIYNVTWPSLENDINLIFQKYEPKLGEATVIGEATVKNGDLVTSDNEAIQEILSIIRRIDKLQSFPTTLDSSIHKSLMDADLTNCTLYSTIIISSLGKDEKAALNAIHQFSSIDISRISDIIKYHGSITLVIPSDNVIKLRNSLPADVVMTINNGIDL